MSVMSLLVRGVDVFAQDGILDKVLALGPPERLPGPTRKELLEPPRRKVYRPGMSEIVVVGGGIAGLSSAMLLARDGHHVTVLERDPAPPPEPSEAWAEWERRGRQPVPPAALLPAPGSARSRSRSCRTCSAPSTPRAPCASTRSRSLPAEITGGWRDGDERFEQITGRRPMVEATFARLAADEPGVEIRRGVAVRGLAAAEPANGDVPHVVGVVTDAGERIDADLVVDAGGRRSALPDWLEAIGARRPVEEADDCGFVYYGRHFRSADGAIPPMFGPPLQPYDSVTWLTLPADNGHVVGDADRQRQGRRDAPGARRRHVGADRARATR